MPDPVVVPEQDPVLTTGVMASVASRIRAQITPSIARRRHTTMVRWLAAAAGMFLDMVANVNFDIEANGELRVLEVMATGSPRCIFDVGANVGDWSARALQLLPRAQIHAFEIVPETAEALTERMQRAGATRVTVNAFGLSDSPGTVPVAHSSEFSEGASAALVQPGSETTLIDCVVDTGDAYCQARGIDQIDLLKVDVEGLENRVLRGFEDMLSRGAIRVVQFEYGHLNSSTRFLLGDFYDLFERHDYRVGKIYPECVEFRPFNPWRDENFKGPNFLAVRATDDELRARLGGVG